ncbi:flippase [Flavimarina sp. Hel_I_48]|uniref:flippase n=1 Tax=Flavimarina sp. Hel_I_48 TaxID=1392488 RepID=UPI0013DA0752|nr:flippase [Flavimarina sp. Hel_I_48]
MKLNKSHRQLTKNFVSLTVVQIANYMLPLISVPIIVRIIGPDKYGTINFAAAFVTYFTLLINYGFEYTATRKIAKDPDNVDNRNTIISEVFFTQCLLFIVAAVVCIIFLYTVPTLREEKLIISYSFLICIGALFTQNWLFQAMQDLSKIAILNFISKLVFTGLILIIIKEKEDYIWQPLLISLIQIAVGIISFVWAFKRYHVKLYLVPLKRCLNVLKEEKMIFFSLVVISLYTTTNTFILGLYQNAEQVGYYTAGQRLIVIAQSVLTIPLAQAFYPYIGKSFGENFQKGITITNKLIPLILLFTGCAALGMFFLGPYIITIFYGEEFEAAITVFQILAFIPLLIALSNVFGIQIMMNLGMDKAFFNITAGGAILSITLNILFIKEWGYIGTTLNWLITEIFIVITMYLFLRKKNIHPVNFSYFKLSVISKGFYEIINRFQK